MKANSQKYQKDLVAWCDDTVAKLQVGNFKEIDVDSLIEEIEGLAGCDRARIRKPRRSFTESSSQTTLC